MTKQFSLVPFFLAAVLVAGCGSSSGTSEPPKPDPDAGPTTPTGVTFSVLITDVSNAVRGGVRAIPGATLIFDKPGGERVEVKAGPDGVATVPYVDWSKGKASLTILADGFVVASLAEFDEAYVRSARFRPVIPGDPKRDLAYFTFAQASKLKKVSGKVTGKQAVAVTMAPTILGSRFGGGGPDYSLTVEGGKPYSLVITDHQGGGTGTVGPRGLQHTFKHWFVVDQPAATGDVVVDFDLGALTPVTPKRIAGKIAIAGGNAGPFGGKSTGNLLVSGVSGALAGGITKCDVNADGTAFEYEVEYLEGVNAIPLRIFSISQPPDDRSPAIDESDGAVSTVRRAGLPVDGEVADGFLTPPPTPDPTHALSEPFRVDFPNIPEDGEVRLELEDSQDLQWFIHVPHGVTTFKAPAMSEAMRIAIGARATVAHLYVLAAVDDALNAFTKTAHGGGFRVSY